MKNWIKLYRKITDWEYYGDNEAVKLFLHILLCADYKTGCYCTTLRQLSAETGVSFKRVRTLLSNFVKTKEIQLQSKTGKKGQTIVIVNNFEKYQSKRTQKEAQKRAQSETAPIKDLQGVTGTETGTETGTNLPYNNIIKENKKENKKEIIIIDDDEASGNFWEKIKIEELHKELRPIYSEDTQTANAIRQKILHEKNRMLEISELEKYFDKFKQKTIAEGETEMTRKEYQKHFANWLLKYIDIENQQRNKKSNSRKPDPKDRLKVTPPQNNGGGYWDR